MVGEGAVIMGHWQDKAACLDADPKLFFPSKGETVAFAQNYCEVCPVRLSCLIFAIENHIDHGIWGGHSERSRRKIKKRGEFIA